jgi:hypothetical protein
MIGAVPARLFQPSDRVVQVLAGVLRTPLPEAEPAQGELDLPEVARIGPILRLLRRHLLEEPPALRDVLLGEGTAPRRRAETAPNEEGFAPVPAIPGYRRELVDDPVQQRDRLPGGSVRVMDAARLGHEPFRISDEGHGQRISKVGVWCLLPHLTAYP